MKACVGVILGKSVIWKNTQGLILFVEHAPRLRTIHKSVKNVRSTLLLYTLRRVIYFDTFPLAFLSVGNFHSRAFSSRNTLVKGLNIGDRLLHQVGQSRDGTSDHGEKGKRFLLETCHISLWSPRHHCVWQCHAARELLCCRSLQASWHIKLVHISRTPSN